MTEAEFSQQLSQLSSVAADLNRESDSINDLLSQYEAQIRALNVGLEVSVGIGCGSLKWTDFFVKIENGRAQKEWGLAVDGRRVLTCSREERIAALNHIPSLVAKLTAEAQARVDTIREAKNLLKK